MGLFFLFYYLLFFYSIQLTNADFLGEITGGLLGTLESEREKKEKEEKMKIAEESILKHMNFMIENVKAEAEYVEKLQNFKEDYNSLEEKLGDLDDPAKANRLHAIKTKLDSLETKFRENPHIVDTAEDPNLTAVREVIEKLSAMESAASNASSEAKYVENDLYEKFGVEPGNALRLHAIKTKLDINAVHCVFVHGLRHTAHEPRVVRTANGEEFPESLTSYWGDVRLWTETENEFRTPCNSYAFVHHDTVDTPWNSLSLAAQVCEALWKPQENQEFEQRVFLHSMGNMIFFNTIASGLCQIHKETTEVYSFGGPFHGSELVDKAASMCKTKADVGVGTKLLNKLPAIAGWFFRKIGDNIDDSTRWFCNKDGTSPESIKSLSTLMPSNYENLNSIPVPSKKVAVQGGVLCYPDYFLGEPSYEQIMSILDTAKKYIVGAICGTDSTGIASCFMDAGPNDGVVSLESCEAFNTDADWSDDPNKSNFITMDKGHSAIIARDGEEDVLKVLSRLGKPKRNELLLVEN